MGNKGSYIYFIIQFNNLRNPEITKIVGLSANDTFALGCINQANVFKIYPHYTCYAGYLLG